MLLPALFPDLSAPSWLTCGISLRHDPLSSLPYQSTPNPGSSFPIGFRSPVGVPCPLSFWGTHGARQSHLPQASSRLPGQSWERWYKPAGHFSSCLLTATRLCPAWKAACFLRVVCSPHFWRRFKPLFLPSDPLVFSGPYWLFRENRNHLMETTSASCQRIFSPDFICTRCPCFLPVLWWRCSSCFQRPPCLLFPSSHPLLLSGDSVFRGSPISLLCLQLLFLSDWPSILAELSTLVLTAPRIRTTPSIWPLATPLQSWRWRHQGPHLLHPVETFCLDITWLPRSILLGWRLLATWHSLSLVLRDATLLVFLFTAQVTLSSWFSASPALNYTYLWGLVLGSFLCHSALFPLVIPSRPWFRFLSLQQWHPAYCNLCPDSTSLSSWPYIHSKSQRQLWLNRANVEGVTSKKKKKKKHNVRVASWVLFGAKSGP